jgi:hypothetical protein
MMVPEAPKATPASAKSASAEPMDVEEGGAAEQRAKQLEDANDGQGKPKEAAPTPATPSLKVVNQIAHVPVFHRKFYSPKRFDLFGRPLILSFDRTTTTHNQLHQMIFDRVVR